MQESDAAPLSSINKEHHLELLDVEHAHNFGRFYFSSQGISVAKYSWNRLIVISLEIAFSFVWVLDSDKGETWGEFKLTSVLLVTSPAKVELRFLGKAGLFEIQGAVHAGSMTFELRHGCMIFIGNALILPIFIMNNQQFLT